MRPAVIIAGCYIALLGLIDIGRAGAEWSRYEEGAAMASVVTAFLRFALVTWMVLG